MCVCVCVCVCVLLCVCVCVRVCVCVCLRRRINAQLFGELKEVEIVLLRQKRVLK
jgi:hypothetical protein